MTRSTLVLIVAPSLQANTFAELLALIKGNPAGVVAGNAGRGTTAELLIAELGEHAGAKLIQVPYKGGAPSMLGVLTGEVQMTVVELNQALPLIQAGKLRALAQFGKTRAEQLPDVPTVGESLPGVDETLWIGMLTASGVPEASVTSLNRLLRDSMADEEMKAWAKSIDAQIDTGPPSELEAIIAKDEKSFGPLIEKYGLRVE